MKDVLALGAVVSTDEASSLGASGFARDCLALRRYLCETSRAYTVAQPGAVPDQCRLLVVDELGRNTRPVDQAAISATLLSWFPGTLVLASNAASLVAPVDGAVCLTVNQGDVHLGLCEECGAVEVVERVLGPEMAQKVRKRL